MRSTVGCFALPFLRPPDHVLSWNVSSLNIAPNATADEAAALIASSWALQGKNASRASALLLQQTHSPQLALAGPLYNESACERVVLNCSSTDPDQRRAYVDPFLPLSTPVRDTTRRHDSLTRRLCFCSRPSGWSYLTGR